MNPSIALAEKVRLRTETRTDYATAKALGISQSNLKQVLAGKRGLGLEACFRAAEILGQDVKEIIAEIELHRASPEKKSFWEKKLPRILPAVAIWGIAAGVTQFSLVRPVEAASAVENIHYAYYEGRRRLRRLLTWIFGDAAARLGCFAT